jgi:hypothetical protein
MQNAVESIRFRNMSVYLNRRARSGEKHRAEANSELQGRDSETDSTIETRG